ncbi:MAG TPA: methyltransferase domain-containing protein [Janthinobacterium sp.]|nr:methyltransferase domain-containing protein [Janthinobacterium sp.]
MITEQLAKYYAHSAQEYDRVYDKPERQDDLDELQEKVAELLRGHRVLEIACGTAYWTETIAATAASVLATDINPEMLELAKARGLDAGKVTFSLADAFDLPADIGTFTACFAGFWWSHVKREDQERFLGQLRSKLGKDVMLVMIDSSYVDGSSTVIARTDLEGNTYQIRNTADGTRYEVLKNFPSDSALRKKLGASVREIRILRLEYYWLLSCRLK